GVAGECPQKVRCAAQARSFDERCAPLIAYEEPSPSSAEGADAGLGPALPSEDASGAAMSASVSRSLPHVLLFSDAEQGNAGFLYDPELQQLAIELHGGWYTYDDVNDCPDEKRTGTIMPPPSQLFVMSSYADSEGVTPPPEGTTPNEFGLRFWGTQHELWGAGAGVAFDNPGRGPQPYDVTKTGATGIRFWAKSALGELDLKVKLEDQYSEPEASPQLCCFLDPNACGTNGCGVDGDVQGCYFAPFVSVSLDTEWQLVTLPFASFAREAGGSWADGEDHTGEPLTLDGVYQLQFEVGTGDFDVWLDNVGFTLE
ncbi:MAG TPA: hypothetical protein VHM70_21120, partial [Polyangiaceae bacterium]|nr:hypothetical protein [Polyangiaceae bacterium]